jgi:hypothetical protein
MNIDAPTQWVDAEQTYTTAKRGCYTVIRQLLDRR